MAKYIQLKQLTSRERGILIEGIPLLRNKGDYFWDDYDFKRIYAKWMNETKGKFHKENPFAQFLTLIQQMKRQQSLEYTSVPDDKKAWWKQDGIIRKVITETPHTKGTE